MATQGPARQHYVPRFLLRNFCDTDGYFWVADRKTLSASKTKPGGSFVIKNLYTNYVSDPKNRGSGLGRFRYEIAIGRLESSAAPVIEKIIGRIEDGTYSGLAQSESDIVKRFLFAMARRTPESQRRLMSSRNFEEVYHEVAQEMAEQQGLPPLDEDSILQGLASERNKREAGRSVDASFAAGDDPRVCLHEAEFCRKTGLWIGNITTRNRSFVIGSHGISIFRLKDSQQGCLPISFDTVVMASPDPESQKLVRIGVAEDWLVKKINMATTQHSRWIAGRSERLVCSLVKRAAGHN